MNARRRSIPGISSLLVLTVGALVFQLGHLAEHTAQMIMWFVHPQRGAWMSPWAQELSLALGRIPASESAEMTSAMQRGMEALHLIGNAVFLLGATGVVVMLGRTSRSPAAVWARAGFWFQLLHTLEHVALTASVFATGRAVGLSTWFGRLDGTSLTTQRVWWHGLVNLCATLMVGRAVFLAVRHAPDDASRRVSLRDRSGRRWSGSPARAALVVSASMVVVLPTTLATTVGRSAADPGGHDHRASNLTDDELAGGAGFVDVAAVRGLDVVHSAFHWDVTGDPVAMMGGGVCWIDVDGDGWQDLFVTDTWSDNEWGLWNSGAGLPTSRIFRNDHGNFEDATEQWGAGFAVRAVGCTAADLDGDGDVDLYVTTSRSNLLLLNRDGEGFDEVAETAGADSYGWQAGSAAGDIDGDGLVDLFLAGYANLNAPRSDADSGFPSTVEPQADVVLFGTGSIDGIPRFTTGDARALGIEPGGAEYGLDVVLIDIDRDGDLDIHVANDTQPNRLYRNDLASSGHFVDIAAAAGVDDDGSGMGVAVADLNPDAVPDFAVTNLEGQGHRVFVSGPSGWADDDGSIGALGVGATGWGIAFPDLDSDGLVDAVVASGDIPLVADTQGLPVEVFQGIDEQGSTSFRARSSGPFSLDLPSMNGRAVAPADYDNDGDLDLLISSIGGQLVLLENRLVQHRSITIDIGSPAAGTIIIVHLADGSSIERQVSSGGHWLSSPDPRIHIGLGLTAKVDSIEIHTPEGDGRLLWASPDGGFVILG